MIKCCKECKEDKSKFLGNCHSQCKKYLYEVEEYRKEKESEREARRLDYLLTGRQDPRHSGKGRREINRGRWK